MSQAEPIEFGTSGLRGRVTSFTPVPIGGFVRAFLHRVVAPQGAKTLYLGLDLRPSSPTIATLVAGVAQSAGWRVVNAGVLPTPALAAYAMARHCPAIMVTGSHVPEDYNGLKFYRRDGELLKSDEEPMRRAAEQFMQDAEGATGQCLPETNAAPIAAYRERYVNAFGPSALKGLRLGVDQHSAAGRDVLVQILQALGAHCVPYNRADNFVAVDTEAVEPDQLEQSRAMLKQHDLHAIVSTDGDGDRPIVVDESGQQIGGDVLGVLTARAIGAKTIVTPLNATTAIEQSRWFNSVIRTRIGSPYVVAAMAGAQGAPVAGFEPNGGFLLQHAIDLPTGSLAALPTRDAALPIIAILWEAARRDVPLSALAAQLPPRFVRACRLKQVPATQSADLLSRLLDDQARGEFDPSLTAAREINTQDGVRLTRQDGTIVHFRASGNAPELRCYVEAGHAAEAERLIEHYAGVLNRHLGRLETMD